MGCLREGGGGEGRRGVAGRAGGWGLRRTSSFASALSRGEKRRGLVSEMNEELTAACG